MVPPPARRVVHYFLAPGMEPVQAAEHLGHDWRKVVELVSAEWTVEHAVGCDDEAVIEFSQQETSPEDASATSGMVPSGTHFATG